MLSTGLKEDTVGLPGADVRQNCRAIHDGTLHGKASPFRYTFASSTSRVCQTDKVTRLSSRQQNVHCGVERANEGSQGSEEMVGVRSARNDVVEQQRFAVET